MTYPQLGDALRRRRDVFKLSMREAAKLGGVSPSAWSDMEAGKFPPSLKTQRAVSKALKWPANWIDQLDELDGATSPVDAPLDALRAQVEELARRFDRLQAQFEAVTGVVVDSPADQAEPPARQSPGGAQ